MMMNEGKLPFALVHQQQLVRQQKASSGGIETYRRRETYMPWILQHEYWGGAARPWYIYAVIMAVLLQEEVEEDPQRPAPPRHRVSRPIESLPNHFIRACFIILKLTGCTTRIEPSGWKSKNVHS